MKDLIQRFIESKIEPPPMPEEAYSPGLIGRHSETARALQEIAWKAMGYQMFMNGVMVASVVILTVMVGIIFRGKIQDYVRGILAHAAQ